jgi:cyclase
MRVGQAGYFETTTKKTRMRSVLGGLLLSIALTGFPRDIVADSVKTKERTVTKLTKGVYAIRHRDAPDQNPQGNTTVIIGDRQVLVVDSAYLPSAAREDIAQIRQWTSVPVRYLVNTHWHYDHTMGNAAYLDAFSPLSIIAQTETRKQIEGYNPGFLVGYEKDTATLRRILETGKDENGKPLTEPEKTYVKSALPGRAPVWEEFKPLAGRLRDLTPNMAFDHELEVDLGKRKVQIKFLGRGNTAGDVVVYLPEEKIVVTGDLVDHPVPYLGGGYPSEEVLTLEKIAALDVDTIVPGHGEVLHGKVYLQQEMELIRMVVSEVHRQIYRVGNGPDNLDDVREAVKKNVDFNALLQQFAGDDKDDRAFFEEFSLKGLVTAAYAESWGK